MTSTTIYNPPCGQCGKDEQECARNGGCCAACDHPFGNYIDGAQEVVSICTKCSQEFEYYWDGQSRRRTLCQPCRNGRRPPYIVVGVEYNWYVYYTGVAHLRKDDRALAVCGKQGNAPNMRPMRIANDWPQRDKCRTCSKHVIQEAA